MGGKTESTNPFRRQAPMTPSRLPSAKLMTKATSPSKMVQKKLVRITSVTGDGNDEIEVPKSPRSTLVT